MANSTLNPYAVNLGSRNPIEVVSETAERLERLVKVLGPEGLKQATAPGKWSAREILCHLGDCEIVFAFRIRQALADDFHVIQPFDQDKWANKYAAYDAHTALVVFSATRQWSLVLLRSVPPATFSKPLKHPERGEMPFQTLVETMAGHDLNHLTQLDTIAARIAPRGLE